MYEYEGHEYSPEEVQQAAEQNGMAVEEYVKEYGLEPVKQEGVVEGEATQAQNQTPDTDSSLEAGSSDSQEIPEFDPSTLGPMKQEQETYMGVPKDGLEVTEEMAEAVKRSDYMLNNANRQFKGNKISAKTKKTPTGDVLDYSDEESLLEFNNNTLGNAIQSDEKIQSLIESRLDQKKDYLEKGMQELMKPYEGMDPKDIPAEAFDKINKQYSKLVNGIIHSDEEINKEIDTYKELISELHNKENDLYVSDFAITSHIDKAQRDMFSLDGNILGKLYSSFPNVYRGAFKGTHGIGTSIKAGGLGVAPYLKVERQHDRNLQRAEAEGWDDNTVGYFNKQGAFVVPKEGGFAPQASGYTERGTWKEAQEKADLVIKNGKEEQKFLLQTVFERQAIESAFGQHDIRDVLKSGKSYETIRGIASEQLPQMASALMSYGIIPAAQMMGDNYLRQVEKEAKLKYNTEQPTIEQMLKVVEDDENDDIFESASLVGAVSGGAEYLGASSVFGRMSNIAKDQAKRGAASLVKGQFKNFFKQQLANGRTYAAGGFDEFITEVTQQFVSDISVNEFEFEPYVQGGGAGALMGTLMPFSGNIASTTTRELSNAYSAAFGKLDIKGMKEFHAYNLKRLDKQLETGEISKNVYENKKRQLDNFMESSQTFDRNMTDAQRTSLMEAQYAKASAEERLSNFRNSEKGQKIKELESIKKEELAVIQTELKEGIITEDQAKKQIRLINTKYNANALFKEYNTLKFDYGQKVIELADNIDFNENLSSTLKAFGEMEIIGENVVVTETNEEFAREFLKTRGITRPSEQQLQAATKEASTTGGVFTKGGKIIINSESAIGKNQSTAGSHEVLHAVLKNTFRAQKNGKSVVNVEGFTNVMNALNDHMLKLEEQGKLKGLDSFRSRIANYQRFKFNNKTYTGQQLYNYARKNNIDFLDLLSKAQEVEMETKNLEEIMTLLSDGLIKGEIEYDASLFEKIGDFLRRLLQSVGLKNIEFNTAEDVFNFVRDYNKSVINGKSTRAQRQFAQYGGRGTLVEVDKNSVEYKAAQDMESVSDLFSKAGPTAAQQEMANKVNSLYDELGPGAVYDIAEMYRPMFRKIVVRGNWDTLPGWDNYKEDIEDEALFDTSGLMGIVMSYKPESGVPLSAYINKYFGLRASNIKDKYLGKTFDKNVDDLKGGGPAVSEEESTTDAIDEGLKQKDAAPEFSRIRRKLALDPQEMNKVRAVVIRTLSLSPDLLSTKKWKPSLFRTFLNEAYKQQIYKAVLEKFPTRSAQFQLWAKVNKGWIEKEISLNTLRRFPALRGVLYDFQTDSKGNVMRYNAEESAKLGIKDPYSGVKKVVRKFPSEKEWADYLDPTRIGRSRNMPHEHKRVLAEAIAIELGMDATLETLQNPNQQQYDLDGMPVEGREINMYERMVENNADVVEENQIVGRVAFLLDRDPTVKFSKAALDAGMAGERMSELIMANPEPLLAAFRDTIAPYRLMVPFKRDNTLGQLKIAMANTLVNTFKSQYPWLDENSARVLSNQLAHDFAAIARRIDAVKLQVHERAEAEFIKALSDNLFNIAENNVLNRGHKAVLGESENSIPPFLTRKVLGKVFVGERANKRIMPWIMGERKGDIYKTPFHDADGTYMNTNSAVSYRNSDLQVDLAEALLRTKSLYANGNLTRDEVRLIFDKIFNDNGSRRSIMSFAAPMGMRMVGSTGMNYQNIFSIPVEYLSGYLANIVVNPRKNASDITEMLGDFITIRVNKNYAQKLVTKQGKGMPHFRDRFRPSALSRISKVPVGKEGTSSTFEVLTQNILPDTLRLTEDGEINYNPSPAVGEIKRSNDDLTQVIGLIDHSALVALDYNGKVAQDINDLMNSDDKFSKSMDDDAINKKRAEEKVNNELRQLLEELEQKGTISQDPVKQAELEEKERLNEMAKQLDEQFNDILQDVTGIDANTEYSKVASQYVGRRKNRRVFFVPPSHDDFKGLIENYLVGKGKEQSQKHRSFFEEYLFEPYYEGVNNYSSERVRMIRQYRNVKKAFKPLFKTMKKEAFPGMSVENAIRIYIWSRKGYEIPNVSEQDIKNSKAFVVRNGLAREAAIEIMKITDLHGHVEPGKHWNGSGIVGDIIDSLKKNSRKKYLEEWNRNVDFILNEKNKNKLRAAFGQEYVEALDNIIYRMKSGRNRLDNIDSKTTSRFMNWLNGSVGVVMFANMRSAALQLISFTNYIEAAGPNNVLNSAAAFANQKQYWSDVVALLKSDYMRERREGLKIDINEAELADATKGAANWFQAAISWFLSKGFMPTQIADSLAIAAGGASYYRNYVNEYIKQGLTEEEAQQRAFIDFRNKTEESQQSSRPDRIGAQQASMAGRLLLTFANTQSQYDRIIKKEISNLKNKRGGAANSIARIAYYGMAQHALFVSLQGALLGALIGFDDDDEGEGINSSEFRLINGMLDSILRGAGIRGHIASVLKNVTVEAIDRNGRPNPDFEMLAFEAANMIPAAGSKLTKLKSMGYYLNKSKDSLGTADMLKDTNFFKANAMAISVSLNIPLDRLLQKYENIENAIDLDGEFETYQQILMAMGWPDYQLGIDKKETKSRSKSRSRSRSRSRNRRR